jgi:hypothetical protein
MPNGGVITVTSWTFNCSVHLFSGVFTSVQSKLTREFRIEHLSSQMQPLAISAGTLTVAMPQ